MRKLILITVLLLPVLLLLSARPAQASETHESIAGNAALNWAEANATGSWYLYGGTGPDYDCSGLVMVAFEHAGIQLPRTTYAMLSSSHLHWIPLSEAGRGDLLFYGTGHVEFDTNWNDTSFGAHDTGTQIGWIHWWPGGWAPTEAFEVY